MTDTKAPLAEEPMTEERNKITLWFNVAVQIQVDTDTGEVQGAYIPIADLSDAEKDKDHPADYSDSGARCLPEDEGIAFEIFWDFLDEARQDHPLRQTPRNPLYVGLKFNSNKVGVNLG